MRPRDAWMVAAVFLALALLIVGLSIPSGGMMGGMMGGTMGAIAFAGIAFLLAVVFLVLAIAGRTEPPPPMPMFVASPAPPSAPNRVVPTSPPASAASVEAAVVKLLEADERLLYLRLRDAGGPVLQKDVVAWKTFSAAKVTRLLDRLERKGLVVRERHGATNRIRLSYGPGISAK